MSARAWSLSLFLAAALTLCLAPGASAQSVYGYSSLDIESSYVTSYSETDLDYYAEAYYYVETDAYLFAGSSVVASGSSYSSVSLGTSTSLDTSYYIQTNHWIVADDDSPYCFSCIAGGWYYGSMTLSTGPDYDGTDDSGWIYVGTTYDYGDTDVSAPSISGVDYTYGGGNEVRGTSGYVILYGSDLTSIYADTSVYCSYCSVAYESEGQINLSYSIPLDTASGTLSDDIDVYVADGGDAYANFYVYDPAPTITSISPSTWTAGTATSVTISGSGFGSSPSVSFSDGYVSFSPSSASDTSISGTVTVGPDDPGGSVTVTVNADAWGGLSFQGRPGGGSGNATAGGSVTPLPPSLSCPASATRGDSITCQISHATAGRISAWQFSDGSGGTVNGSGGSTSWSGTMVVSGTITATVSGYGPLTAGVTVNARSGWHTSALSPVLESDGTLIWTGSTATLLPSPPASGEPIGYFNLRESASDSYAQVNSGPNQGYFYIVSVSYPGVSNFFQWELAADLANSSSTFSVNQCGTNGFISYSNLLADTSRHEAGQVAQSHWINYSNSLSTNNFGNWAESETAAPGTTTLPSFGALIDRKFATLDGQIGSDAAVEPYGVADDINGISQGYINYAPYTSNTCP